jgi:predicted DNA binding protein
MSDARALTERERALIAAAREKAYILYQGRQVPHRSCGIALAETFGLATPAYQSLRRGGITGCGACGATRGVP